MGEWMDNVGKGHHKNKWEMRMMTGWGMRECVMRCLFGGKLSLSLCRRTHVTNKLELRRTFVPYHSVRSVPQPIAVVIGSFEEGRNR